MKAVAARFRAIVLELVLPAFLQPRHVTHRPLPETCRIHSNVAMYVFIRWNPIRNGDCSKSDCSIDRIRQQRAISPGLVLAKGTGHRYILPIGPGLDEIQNLEDKEPDHVCTCSTRNNIASEQQSFDSKQRHNCSRFGCVRARRY